MGPRSLKLRAYPVTTKNEPTLQGTFHGIRVGAKEPSEAEVSKNREDSGEPPACCLNHEVKGCGDKKERCGGADGFSGYAEEEKSREDKGKLPCLYANVEAEEGRGQRIFRHADAL